MFTCIFNNLNRLRMAWGLLWLTPIAMQAGSEKRMELAEALREGTWQVAMWMRCCAACKQVFRKARLYDHFCCECGWEMVTAMANVIEYYVPRNSANRAENGFRPSSAERSSCFPYRKRSQHDVQMQRMKRVRGKFAASQAGLGNCQE
jgi:hypothetical protein